MNLEEIRKAMRRHSEGALRKSRAFKERMQVAELKSSERIASMREEGAGKRQKIGGEISSRLGREEIEGRRSLAGMEIGTRQGIAKMQYGEPSGGPSLRRAQAAKLTSEVGVGEREVGIREKEFQMKQEEADWFKNMMADYIGKKKKGNVATPGVGGYTPQAEERIEEIMSIYGGF